LNEAAKKARGSETVGGLPRIYYFTKGHMTLDQRGQSNWYSELSLVKAGMVAHSAEYLWSSYQYNVLGKPIELITPHFLYQGLTQTGKTRQKRYAALFDKRIPDYYVEEICHSIKRAWVLGDEWFKQQIEKQTSRYA